MGGVLGLLGGGGSTLALPILAYIAGLEAGDAIASSLVVVGCTALVSSILHARKGQVRWRTGSSFGAVAMVGAYAGGRLSALLPGWLLLSLFAGLMITTATLMLFGATLRGDRPATDRAQVWRICLQGFFVGALTGLVGAGGGFLIVPSLVLLGGLPMHHAVGTALLVIAMNSASGLLGHLPHANVPWTLTLSFTGVAILGSTLGASVASRMPAAILRSVFAWFVLAMGLLILTKELAPVGGLVPALLASCVLFTAILTVQIRRYRRGRRLAIEHPDEG